MSNEHTKNVKDKHPVPDFSKGVRGKYYERAMAGSNVVLLDADVMESFPDSKSVNEALRSLRDLAVRLQVRSKTVA